MDIQPAEQERLSRLFQHCQENPEKLNSFEKSFTDDNYDRFLADKGGDNGYFVSPKMWAIFHKLETKLKLEAY